jgi:malonate transporter
MLAFFTVLPIFGLILAGWVARRIGALGEAATHEINRFVVQLALPALLIDVVINAKPAEIWQPGFIAAAFLGCSVVFAVTVAVSLARKRPLADAAIAGLNSGYANTGFMGFPVALAVLGPAAQPLALLAVLSTVCGIFAIALVLVEIGQQAQASPARLVLNVLKSLAKNPLIAAPVLGGVLLAFGVHLPAPADKMLKMLGGAASPCALVCLGMFLAEKRPARASDTPATVALTAAKLVVHPLATWVLSAYVFRLPPLLTHAAVLMAALPTGTGPFMVAEFYKREATVTARVVLISTILSVATLTALIAVISA